MDRNDYDRSCKYYLCKKCYHPCHVSCTSRSYCEQCSFGYKNIVDKFKTKYSKEELEIIKETCKYAEWALEDLQKIENYR